MYNEFFGFKESPFSIAPDPRYLYMTAQHRDALAHLVYGLNSEGGCILLTGEVGTGKTTICRCLLEQLPEQANVALLLNPKVSEIELLETICDELHISYPAADNSVKTYTDRIYDFLIESNRNNEKTVLIIDEAQNLDSKVLEQLRLLTNLETDQRKLLQIIILGQPELLNILAKTEMRQLAQRITARFHLQPLTKNEVKAYVSHRLAVAGQNIQLFPENSIKLLYKLSNGVPRLINIISDRALLGAYVENQYAVNPGIIKKAANEVFGELKNVEKQQKNKQRLYPAVFLSIVTVLVIALTLFITLSPQGTFDRFLTTAMMEVNNKDQPVAADNILSSTGEPETTETSSDMQNTGSTSVADMNPAERNPTINLAGDRYTGEVITKNAAVSDYDDIEQILNDTGSNPISAYQQLFSSWDQHYDELSGKPACKQAEKFSLSCLYKQGNLNNLKIHNRPAVLTLYNSRGEIRYVTITSIDNESATIVSNKTPYTVKLSDLDKHWYGQFTLLWRKPEYYSSVITPGDKGNIVSWLHTQLTIINHDALSDMIISTYDDYMIDRVKSFQLAQGLTADGIVGPLTIIHLNTESGMSVPALVPSSTRQG